MTDKSSDEELFSQDMLNFLDELEAGQKKGAEGNSEISDIWGAFGELESMDFPELAEYDKLNNFFLFFINSPNDLLIVVFVLYMEFPLSKVNFPKRC